MFLNYILQEEKSSLIFKFLKTQKENPSKYDWRLTVEEDLSKLNIKMEFKDIEKISKYRFKEIVNSNIDKEAFEYVLDVKRKHSKVIYRLSQKNGAVQNATMSLS